MHQLRADEFDGGRIKAFLEDGWYSGQELMDAARAVQRETARVYGFEPVSYYFWLGRDAD